MYARAVARINGQKAYYTEPTFQKLLPDKDKIPGGVPELTLVLSLEDLLLHSEWSTKHGYRLAKRPGLDYFLRYLSSQYELVIFTTVKNMDADPIIRKLDPFRLVMWPLFREATRFEKGEYIKVRHSLPPYHPCTNTIRTSPTSTATSPKSSSWTPTPRTSNCSPKTPSSSPNGKATPPTKASSP
jgi:import inner membrane translocase subunit TIM50